MMRYTVAFVGAFLWHKKKYIVKKMRDYRAKDSPSRPKRGAYPEWLWLEDQKD